MDDNQRFKREILGVSILLTLGSLFILYPFLDALILALVTSYLLRFAHDKLNMKLQNDLLSSFIIITGVLGFISLGIYLFIDNVNAIISGIGVISGSLQTGIENIFNFFELSDNLRRSLETFINSLSIRIRASLESTVAGLPYLFIDIAVYLFTSIYFYKDGKKIERKIDEVVRNLPNNERKIIKSLIRSTDSIFRGIFVTQFLVALIIAIISGIGFYLISLVTSPMPLIPLWAILIGVAALLPLVAAFMFYAPIGIYYLITGDPFKGSLIIAFGVLVLNILPEVLIRPYVGSRQMDEHPLIIFIGFIAGPLALGLKGLILGPLLLILSKEFVLNYTDLVSE